MATLNYTTTVPVVRTIGEIQDALSGHGASSIATDYAEGKPIGLSFIVPTPHGPRQFSMPVDVDAVHRLLVNQKAGRDGHKRNPRVDDRRAQAERVAWRVMREWLLAQLAIIEAQMASLDQVMLPYLKVDADHTLYQSYKEHELMAIDA